MLSFLQVVSKTHIIHSTNLWIAISILIIVIENIRSAKAYSGFYFWKLVTHLGICSRKGIERAISQFSLPLKSILPAKYCTETYPVAFSKSCIGKTSVHPVLRCIEIGFET